MSYSVSGNKWIFPAGVADVYCVYHIYISSFHQPAPFSIIKLYSYSNSTDWKEMCVHNMHQEINPDTATGTHSAHYMCQRSRIYSGHLCSTGVEKGKKIGLSVMNWTLWVLQRIIPMHWLTGTAIHQGSNGWLCRTGLSWTHNHIYTIPPSGPSWCLPTLLQSHTKPGPALFPWVLGAQAYLL